jgi:hypothetical protein
VTYSVYYEEGGDYAQIKDVLCPRETPRNTAPERWVHRIKTHSARTPTLALPTLPIEYQYFKFRIIAISSGIDGSSCFIII